VQVGVLHVLPGILGDRHTGAAAGEGPARDFHGAQHSLPVGQVCDRVRSNQIARSHKARKGGGSRG